MGSIFSEMIVKRKTSFAAYAARALCVIATILVFFLSIFVNVFWLLLAFFVCYGTYLVFQYTDVEYEYSCHDNEIMFDKVYAKSRRKDDSCFDLKKVEIVAKPEHDKMANYMRRTDMVTFDYSSGEMTDDLYVMIIGYGAGVARVYFEPNDDLLERIRTVVPSKVFKG